MELPRVRRAGKVVPLACSAAFVFALPQHRTNRLAHVDGERTALLVRNMRA
jgi:hypothetical protein